MLARSFLVASTALVVAGCATTTVPPPDGRNSVRPKVNNDYRDMAAVIMGKKGDAIKVPPDRDLSAKIQLEPTPGRRQVRKDEGEYRGEVLTSGPYSDGYVTGLCNFFSVNIPGRFHWDDEISLSS